MANRTKGYGSYRGREHPVFRLLLALLAIAAVLVVVGFFLLQPYIIYSADGVQINLPFLSKELPIDEPIATPELVVERPEATPPPPPTTFQLAQQIHTYLSVDAKHLTNADADSLPAGPKDMGYALRMKDESGVLPYVSAVEKAISMRASGSDIVINETIEGLTSRYQAYTVAVMSCFKDQAAGDGDYEFCILSNSGYRWVDDSNIRWISPTKSAVRQYVIDLALEAADFGFDEILLTYAHYPASGTFGYIKNGTDYDQNQLSTVIDGFYQEVRTAFADRDTMVSVYVCDEFLENPEEFRSGQTAASMLANFDRIWYNEALEHLVLERVFGGDAALMSELGVAIATASSDFPLY